MRVIITGSRDWEGRLAEREIHRVLDTLEHLAGLLESPLVIVHGGCPTGADAIVDRWARRRDYEPEVHAPDFSLKGDPMPARNIYMIHKGADMFIGFIRDDRDGREVQALLDLAKSWIPTYTILWEDYMDMRLASE